MLRDQVDAIGVGVGKIGTYGGAGSAVFFGLSAGEFAALGGLVIAALGYVTQLFFNHRREKRERAEYEANERRAQQEFEKRMRSYGGSD